MFMRQTERRAPAKSAQPTIMPSGLGPNDESSAPRRRVQIRMESQLPIQTLALVLSLQ